MTINTSHRIPFKLYPLQQNRLFPNFLFHIPLTLYKIYLKILKIDLQAIICQTFLYCEGPFAFKKDEEQLTTLHFKVGCGDYEYLEGLLIPFLKTIHFQLLHVSRLWNHLLSVYYQFPYHPWQNPYLFLPLHHHLFHPCLNFKFY